MPRGRARQHKLIRPDEALVLRRYFVFWRTYDLHLTYDSICVATLDTDSSSAEISDPVVDGLSFLPRDRISSHVSSFFYKHLVIILSSVNHPFHPAGWPTPLV